MYCIIQAHITCQSNLPQGCQYIYLYYIIFYLDAPEPLDRLSTCGKQRSRHPNGTRQNTPGSPSSVTFHQKLQDGGLYLPYTYNGNQATSSSESISSLGRRCPMSLRNRCLSSATLYTCCGVRTNIRHVLLPPLSWLSSPSFPSYHALLSSPNHCIAIVTWPNYLSCWLLTKWCSKFIGRWS